MKRLLEAVSVSMVVALLSLATTSGVADASPPPLSSELLGIGALPAGWIVAHPSSGADVGCFHSLFKPKGVHPTGYAKVGFENRGTLQVFVEALATYANAHDAYQRIIAAMSSCKRVDGLTNGKVTTIVAKRVSFTHYGSASTAFSVHLVIQGFTMRDDVLIVRKGASSWGLKKVDSRRSTCTSTWVSSRGRWRESRLDEYVTAVPATLVRCARSRRRGAPRPQGVHREASQSHRWTSSSRVSSRSRGREANH